MRAKTLCWSLLAAGALLASCKKEPAAERDPHQAKALSLIRSDPDQALREFAKIKVQDDARVSFGKGLAFEAKRDWSRAAGELARAKALAPNNAEVRAALGRVLLIAGKVAEARPELEAAVRLSPREAGAALLLAAVARTPEEHASALKALETTAPKDKARRVSLEYLVLRAASEQATGGGERAAELLKQAESAALGDTKSALVLATIAHAEQKPTIASALATKITRESREPSELVPAAEIAFSLQDLAAVKDALKRLPMHPPNPDVLFLDARRLLAEDRTSDAIQRLREAEKATASPERRNQISLTLAETLVATKASASAVAVLKELLERSPGNVDAELLWARIAVESGRPAEAVARLRSLPEAERRRDEFALVLGGAELAAKDAPAAEVTFRELASRSRDKRAARRGWVAALEAQSKHAEAAEVLENALAAAPADIGALEELALLHLRRRAPKQAIEAVQRRVQGAPDPVAVELVLAEVYDKLGREGEVGRLLQGTVLAHPGSSAAHAALGRWYAKNGKREEAVKALLEARKLEPSSMPLLAELAKFHAAARQMELALARYEELSQLDPRNFVGPNNAAMLCANELNQPERAVQFAREASKRAPAHPGVADTLGWALLKRGDAKDVAEAVELLAGASRRLRLPEVQYHYGVALLRSGDLSAGRLALGEAVKNPKDFRGKADAKALLASNASPEGT